MKVLKVFISYSRTGIDRAFAGLLAASLKKIGIEPLYDEALYAGAVIGEQVCDNIRLADVFLIVLTDRSETSMWVNQEIGFAKALQKPIIPVPIEETAQSRGMIRGMRQFECSNWFSHDNSIKRLRTDIETAIARQDEPPPVVIPNELQRTEEMIKSLKGVYIQLESDQKLRLRLYEKSALSIFSVDDKAPPTYDSHYWDLLCEQRIAMEKLVKHERVETRLHMWPETRQYDVNAMRLRVDIVYKWLKMDEQSPGLKVCIATHDGPNIMAVDEQFAFEGLRTNSAGEYKYTLYWRYPSEKIEKCFSDFDSDKKWMSPSKAAELFREVSDKLLGSNRTDSRSTT